MSSRYIAEDVRKRLYAESLGRCMNPACQKKLFSGNGDIIEMETKLFGINSRLKFCRIIKN